MGGPGAGHKSVEATQARMVNIQKARAARRRAPLPWRSEMESRVIEQLVWQWFLEVRGQRLEVGERRENRDSASRAGRVNSAPTKAQPSDEQAKARRGQSSGEWPAFAEATVRQASGEKRQLQIPPTAKGSDALRETGAESSAPTVVETGKSARKAADLRKGGEVPRYKGERAWAKYRVARLLGVSHTWVNKLVKKFEADPERMRRKMRAFAPASFEKLERAREETQRQRELGRLRGPIRWRRVKITLQGRKRKMAAPTRAEMERRDALRAVASDKCRVTSGQRQVALRATGAASSAPTKENAMYVSYQELPGWARGFVLPGELGTRNVPLVGQAGRGAGAMMPVKKGTPRPVPFAFRRRR